MESDVKYSKKYYYDDVGKGERSSGKEVGYGDKERDREDDRQRCRERGGEQGSGRDYVDDDDDIERYRNKEMEKDRERERESERERDSEQALFQKEKGQIGLLGALTHQVEMVDLRGKQNR